MSLIVPNGPTVILQVQEMSDGSVRPVGVLINGFDVPQVFHADVVAEPGQPLAVTIRLRPSSVQTVVVVE